MELRTQPGSSRIIDGITWTATEFLKTWNGEPRGVIWRAAGPLYRIEEAWSHCTGDRFMSEGVYCKSFEKAAERCVKQLTRRVNEAKELLSELSKHPELRAVVK